MKRELLLVFLLVSTWSYSQEKEKNEEVSSFFKSISWSVDILSFGRITNFEKDLGTTNPNNRIVELNDIDGGLYLRPDLSYKKEKISFWIKPRFNMEVVENESNTEFYFQQAKVKYQINEASYVSGGRYIKSIGTSTFINPSNPFFLETGRLNPKIELRPTDFIEYNFTRKNLDFTLLANISKGEQLLFNDNLFKFDNQYGVMSEYYGNSITIGGIFTLSKNKRYHLGFYGQKNLNDAMVVWFDGAVNYNPNRFYPVHEHSTGLLGYEMVNGRENEKMFFTGLVGTSYTFKFGPTLNFEYLYNGKGYDSETFNLYDTLIKDASNYNFDITLDLANLNLGRALNTGMPYLRQHYIFTQLGENDLFGKLSYNLRYFYDLTDNSSQFSSLIEWNILDNLEIFSVFLSNMGKEQTSFNQLINSQFMIGGIWRF
jgi:hypothetical protein